MRIRGERPERCAAEAPIGCARGAEYRSRNTATSRSFAAWERRHWGPGWRCAARRGRGRAEWPWGPVTSLGHWFDGHRGVGTEGWSASPPRTATARRMVWSSCPYLGCRPAVGTPGIGTYPEALGPVGGFDLYADV